MNKAKFLSELVQLDPEERAEIEAFARTYHAKVCSGETRIAIVFPRERIVFKFPYYENTDHDYCTMEAEKYALAKKYHVEDICLPVTLVGRFDEAHPIYEQPMYRCSHEDCPTLGSFRDKCNVTRELESRVKDNCFDGWRINSLWMRRAIQIYGKKFMRSFELWTNEAHVNDLHITNVGYFKKRPVIIDYAGYIG